MGFVALASHIALWMNTLPRTIEKKYKICPPPESLGTSASVLPSLRQGLDSAVGLSMERQAGVAGVSGVCVVSPPVLLQSVCLVPADPSRVCADLSSLSSLPPASPASYLPSLPRSLPASIFPILLSLLLSSRTLAEFHSRILSLWRAEMVEVIEKNVDRPLPLLRSTPLQRQCCSPPLARHS